MYSYTQTMPRAFDSTISSDHNIAFQPTNHYLIFFAFNLIVSSFTKIPFPLYGSGTLHARILAANCITTSLSTPSNRILVGCGVLALTPSGTPNSIGCE